MAKRMLSSKIIDSDIFLDMPQTSQLLYFHLAMRTDDDGFVGNPKKIMRMIGSADNDLSVLVGKAFIISFPSGVIVIKHHRMNNNWDKYNCKRTQYIDEFNQLFIKENGAYTLDNTQGESVQTDNRLKQVFRIEENRIDKNRKENKKEEIEVLEIPETINKDAWNEWEAYRKERKLSSYKNRSKKVVWNFLSEYSKEDQMKVINQSIKNNWQGLFELKDKQKTGKSLKI